MRHRCSGHSPSDCQQSRTSVSVILVSAEQDLSVSDPVMSSPEVTPVLDIRSHSKLAPMYTIDQVMMMMMIMIMMMMIMTMYTIDQILGHNTLPSSQGPQTSPNIKGEISFNFQSIE